ncbi:MAG: glycosyltransferase [Acidobacteriota bacterium]
MKAFKVCAIGWLTGEEEYLEASLRSVMGHVERVAIAVPRRDRVVSSAKQLRARFQETIQLLEGNWRSEEEAFGELSRLLAHDGFTHALLWDPADVFPGKDLHRLLEWVRGNPDTGQFHLLGHSYWKSPAYRIDPPDTQPVAILTRIGLNIRFAAGRISNATPAALVPPEIARFHSFRFATRWPVLKNWLIARHCASERLNQWKASVWETWDTQRSLRSLHPIDPNRFKSAVRINPLGLPEVLGDHPYVKDLVAGIEPRSKPEVSLILNIRSPIEHVQRVLENLAETAPADIELVACLPADQRDTIKRLRSRPAVKVVERNDRNGPDMVCFERAVAACEGTNLLFLDDGGAFSGDWVEGFQLALERMPECLLVGRQLAIDESTGPETRRLLFEQHRGRRFQQISPLRRAFRPDADYPWACTRGTWLRLQREGWAWESAQPCFLEDTITFRPARSLTEADASIEPGQEIPPDPALRSVPLVSIIVPVYNNLPYTKACLESIFEHTRPGSYEIVVVDNGSTDGSRGYLAGLEPSIRYIRNLSNLFFARGCNRGAWASRGENLLFLNNDTVVTEGWLEAMVEVLNQSEQIGIVGNKQLFPPNHPVYPNRVWHAGIILTPDRAPLQIYYGFTSDHPLVNQQRDYPAVIGSCFLIRRALFQKLGGFDDQFQNGHEETDLCLRARELGHRVVYTPKSVIVHFVSSTEGRFDREMANLQRLRNKWSGQLTSSEPECYAEVGLCPSRERRPPVRVGFVSTFNQRCRLSAYGEQLLAEFSEDTFTVLSESAICDHKGCPDPPWVIRAWNRRGDWYYPLLRWSLSLDFDVIHVNYDANLFPTGLLNYLKDLRNHGKKITLTLHKTCEPPERLRELADHSDAIVVHSETNRLELIMAGCAPSKVAVIEPGAPHPAGIDLVQARRALGLPLSPRLVAIPGFVEPRKGLLPLIEAVAQLKTELDLCLMVLGGAAELNDEAAAYLETCRTAVRQHHLEKQVWFFEDYLEDRELRLHLSAANAIVLPYQSQIHAWSSAAAYALSCGRPVVTSMSPMFEPFRNAVMRVDSSCSLAQAISRVLTNSALSDELSRQALRFCQQHTWKKAADRHWHLYRTLAENSRPEAMTPWPLQAEESEGSAAQAVTEVFDQIAPHLEGSIIEFGSQSLPFTRLLRPTVSVRENPSRRDISIDQGMPIPVQSIDDFSGSSMASQVFNTIILHTDDGSDRCASLVLSLAPHLEENQRILILASRPSAVQDKLNSLLRGHLEVELTALEDGCGLIRIHPCVSGVQESSRGVSSRRNCTREAWLLRGDFYGRGSQAESSRSLALAWALGDSPVQIENTTVHEGLLDGPTLLRLRQLEVTPLPDSTVVNLDATASATDIETNAVRLTRYALPGDRMLEKTKQSLETGRLCLIPSSFHQQVCLEAGIAPEKLLVIPEVITAEAFRKDLSPLPIAGARSFNFLSIFPWTFRKGWDVLLRAFLEEFQPDEDVALVLNVCVDQNLERPANVTNELAAFVRSRLGRDPASLTHVLLVLQDLTARQTLQLYRACQAFVLPSRAEATGRSLFKAMAAELPLICTNWGGQSDRINESNAFLVPHQLVDVPDRMRRNARDYSGRRWAEPSVEHLRRLMRYVLLNSREARARASKGRLDVQSASPPQSALQRIRELVWTARNAPTTTTESGQSLGRPSVIWEGPQLVNHSLALVNREMELALDDSHKVQLSVQPVGADSFSTTLHNRFRSLPSRYFRPLDRVDVHVRHQWPPNWTPPAEGRWVLIQPWEYGNLPLEWVENINQAVDEVWVPSSFVRRLYMESGVPPCRVHVVPNGVDTDCFRPGLAPFSLRTKKRFKFLFLGGTIHRKGVDLLLQAYLKSFSRDDDVALIIKDMGTRGLYQGQGMGQQITQLQQDPKVAAIEYLDQDLSDREIAALYNACQCLVHPYRGEGFGLPVLEAMSCALPVIVTEGGATDDFVDSSVGYLVSSTPQVFGNREIGGLHTTGDLWMLEPDPTALASALQHACQNREEALEKGQAGRRRVVEGWTWNHAADLALKRIEELRRKPVRRFLQQVEGAVLFDFSGSPDVSAEAARASLISLRQNSYVKLKVFFRGKSDKWLADFPEVSTLPDHTFEGCLHAIRSQVGAKYLVLVTAPLLFSKQWFSQLLSVGNECGAPTRILCPSVNLEGAKNYLSFDSFPDEFAFQRFARSVWRSERGQYRAMDALPAACAMANWDCLESGLSEVPRDWSEWLATLMGQGARIFWVQDTVMAEVRSPVPGLVMQECLS